MLRELITKDIFKMSKILKKMGLKINIEGEKVIDENGKEEIKIKSQKQMGLEFVLTVFENLHLAENEVNEFLSDMANMTVEEFEKLPVAKTLEIIKEFKRIDGLSDFFQSASQ